MTSQQKMVMWMAIITVVLLLAGAGTALAYDVYVKRDDNALVRVLAPALPAARVGSHVISYADFLAARDTIGIYLKSDAAQASGLAGPLTPDVEKNALDRLVREAVDAELAMQKNVSVSDSETLDAFAELTAQTSSTVPNVAQYLKETFDWNEQQFREKVIYPALLEQKLEQTFVTSTSGTDEALMTDGATLFNAYLSKRAGDPDIKEYLRFPADVNPVVVISDTPAAAPSDSAQ